MRSSDHMALYYVLQACAAEDAMAAYLASIDNSGLADSTQIDWLIDSTTRNHERHIEALIDIANSYVTKATWYDCAWITSKRGREYVIEALRSRIEGGAIDD